MPCRYQQTFDLRRQMRPVQQTLPLNPTGSSAWARLEAAPWEAVGAVIQDLQEIGDICDETDVVVPVVSGGKGHFSGIDGGMGSCAVPDLAHKTDEEIAPIRSNGILQTFVKDVREQLYRSARKDGIDPKTLPHDPQRAIKRGCGYRLYVPPWLDDKKFIASIEKKIRTSALPHIGALRDLHEGEEAMGNLVTELFMETGWNPLVDSATPPRSVRESGDLSKMLHDFEVAQERAHGVSLSPLVNVGLLSEHLYHNGSEETCAMTATWLSPKGFVGESLNGLTSEDMDEVHEIIQSKLYGQRLDWSRSSGYRTTPQHQIDEAAERIWARMRSVDGCYEGMRRHDVQGFQEQVQAYSLGGAMHRMAGEPVIEIGSIPVQTTNGGGRFQVRDPGALVT